MSTSSSQHDHSSEHSTFDLSKWDFPENMDAEDTIFKKIINGDIPAEKVFENEKFLAFKDINPQAPIHVLVIPKKAIPSLAHMTEEDIPLIGELMATVSHVAKELGLTSFKTHINTGTNAGQTVFHLHAHITGGFTTTSEAAPK